MRLGSIYLLRGEWNILDWLGQDSRLGQDRLGYARLGYARLVN